MKTAANASILFWTGVVLDNKHFKKFYTVGVEFKTFIRFIRTRPNENAFFC